MPLVASRHVVCELVVDERGVVMWSVHRVILFEVLSQISDKEHDGDRTTQYRAACLDG
jgi:hypothetical protein